MTLPPPIPEPLWNTVPPGAQAAILAILDADQKRIAELERRVRSDRTEAEAARTAEHAEARWTTRPSQGRPPLGTPREAPLVPRLQAHRLPCLWRNPPRRR